VKRELVTDIQGKRKKGQPTSRWKDAFKRDMNTVDLSTVEMIDKATTRKKINSLTGDTTGM